MEPFDLTPDLLLRAYANGIFPMSESRDDPEVFWVDPERRGVLPLNSFHISRSLARRIKSGVYAITFDADFAAVVQGCANRSETWINDPIAELCGELHRAGFAHSIEVWSGSKLVGGCYGITLGAAFFGESMFSTQTDASKVALAHLTHRLSKCGYQLFDTQFLTPHLESLGAVEISRKAYRRQLATALSLDAVFDASTPAPDAQEIIQRNAQTS